MYIHRKEHSNSNRNTNSQSPFGVHRIEIKVHMYECICMHFTLMSESSTNQLTSLNVMCTCTTLGIRRS